MNDRAAYFLFAVPVSTPERIRDGPIHPAPKKPIPGLEPRPALTCFKAVLLLAESLDRLSVKG
ncbi:hypothetical protein [Hoeflea sp. BAL378]|uniref:hypothetical protein n=1 Tax=Hoeflea sp. BAL378 TaxID=1547437 RepID=UPI001269921B|nr:hypothetical protein [Hoeflea sp. BAL378]